MQKGACYGGSDDSLLKRWFVNVLVWSGVGILSAILLALIVLTFTLRSESTVPPVTISQSGIGHWKPGDDGTYYFFAYADGRYLGRVRAENDWWYAYEEETVNSGKFIDEQSAKRWVENQAQEYKQKQEKK